MASEYVEQLANVALESGLVVFAGAGLSVPSPSGLPGWRDLNTAFLDSLCWRIAEHTEGKLGGPNLLKWLVQRRDEKGVIPPDFQAQLAEDECGLDYFHMLKVLNIDAWNLGHWSLAVLAKEGVLRALVTTNFDQLAEHALKKVGVKPRVFRTVEDFERLNDVLGDLAESGVLPVIKAHGCVDHPQSMVDTLRQRVRGRPVALERAIATLIGRHASLVVGFSGADLLERPHYLGLANGAQQSPCFVWLNQAGREPLDAATKLVTESGARARMVDAELPHALECLRGRLTGPRSSPILPWSGESDFPGLRKQMLASEVYLNWGERLDPISAVNILATLAEAAGANTHSAELLIGMWSHIRALKYRDDGPFLRYLRLLGRELVERALLGPSASALGSEQKKTGNVAFDLLLRAGSDLKSPDALAEAARAAYYSGNVKSATTMARAALKLMDDESDDDVHSDKLRIADACVTLSGVLRRTGGLTEGLSLLETARRIAVELGDEPSRSRVLSELARALASLDRMDEAEAHLVDAEKIARRLQFALLGADVEAARGRVALLKDQFELALGHLARASRAYEKLVRPTRWAETLLDLLRAARLGKHTEEVQFACSRLEQLTKDLPVLAIDFRLWYAASYLDAQQYEEARRAIEYTRILAVGMEHVHALTTVDALEALLAQKMPAKVSSPAAPSS